MLAGKYADEKYICVYPEAVTNAKAMPIGGASSVIWFSHGILLLLREEEVKNTTLGVSEIWRAVFLNH
ncbi:hypothetical protein V4762_03720 [Thermodesulfobium sp. 4217-1]|uniref:hypothetical protein n=1 Tax=Thermodesulfobium sp. 4217-1 TaxID=3120013 RepID=UPI003221ED38